MKIVIFKLEDKEYGVEIEQIREVIRMKEFTPVPDAAEFVEGVIILRGEVVPLISLRKKLSLCEVKSSKQNRILVTEIDSHSIGVVVDSVSDVVVFDEASITSPDDLLKEANYLIGVGRIGERLILIVDIKKLLEDKGKEGIKEIYNRVEIRKKDRHAI